MAAGEGRCSARAGRLSSAHDHGIRYANALPERVRRAGGDRDLRPPAERTYYSRAGRWMDARRDEGAAGRPPMARGQAVVGTLPGAPNVVCVRLAEAVQVRLRAPPGISLLLNPNFSYASCLPPIRQISWECTSLGSQEGGGTGGRRNVRQHSRLLAARVVG